MIRSQPRLDAFRDELEKLALGQWGRAGVGALVGAPVGAGAGYLAADDKHKRTGALAGGLLGAGLGAGAGLLHHRWKGPQATSALPGGSPVSPSPPPVESAVAPGWHEVDLHLGARDVAKDYGSHTGGTPHATASAIPSGGEYWDVADELSQAGLPERDHVGRRLRVVPQAAVEGKDLSHLELHPDSIGDPELKARVAEYMKARVNPDDPTSYMWDTPGEPLKAKVRLDLSPWAERSEGRTDVRNLLSDLGIPADGDWYDRVDAYRAGGTKKQAFDDELKKLSFLFLPAMGRGGVSLGHKNIPVQAQVGYGNLMGVLPVPDVSVRIGDESGGGRGGTSFGSDAGHIPETHLYYRPGVPGKLRGMAGRDIPIPGVAQTALGAGVGAVLGGGAAALLGRDPGGGIAIGAGLGGLGAGARYLAEKRKEPMHYKGRIYSPGNPASGLPPTRWDRYERNERIIAQQMSPDKPGA